MIKNLTIRAPMPPRDVCAAAAQTLAKGLR